MAAKQTHIIVGGGLAGLMATIKLAEAGHKVQLFSIVPVKRSHSVCAQGGINAAMNLKGEGDSPLEHFDDSIYGGDFLANQPLVKRMCETAPAIINLLDRMGVMFNRTPEGHLDFRRFGGTKYSRTAFAGATTGQQIIYALDEQVRRFEVEGFVEKFETWEFLSAVMDNEPRCRGIVAMDLKSMGVRAFPADAVMLCTGGPGLIFGKSTNSMICTGGAASSVFQQGVFYANGEFIQVHPTAIPGQDKLRLMSESARGEGGRMWTYKDGKPWYFLEEWYPAYGNLVPRDIASRAIHKVVHEMGLGVDGKAIVYLDVSHIDKEQLDRKLKGILEIYERFVGLDPRKVPMMVFPAVHYSMGGIWVDNENQMTNIPGLFAAGECDYQYHGANRLGANSLVSAIFGGLIGGPAMIKYASSGIKPVQDQMIFSKEVKRQEEFNNKLLKSDGPENIGKLHDELGDIMSKNVTVVRYNKKLEETDQAIQKLQERFKKISLNDPSDYSNMALTYARQLFNMLILARVITRGALLRNESRGAHYKPDFPERDDKNFLKTTKAKFTPSGPEFSFEAVDTSLIPPRPRKYDVEKKATTKGTP